MRKTRIIDNLLVGSLGFLKDLLGDHIYARVGAERMGWIKVLHELLFIYVKNTILIEFSYCSCESEKFDLCMHPSKVSYVLL